MSESAPDNSQKRRDWLSLLAKAPAGRLTVLFDALGPVPSAERLRPPETGTVMVRGRTGATGAPFNLGEMTVTRCSLRLTDGRVGHGYVAGRDRRHAEIAAHCDALLQGPEAARVEAAVIGPLAREAEARRRETAAKAAATKVEFFTMARGEDP